MTVARLAQLRVIFVMSSRNLTIYFEIISKYKKLKNTDIAI